VASIAAGNGNPSFTHPGVAPTADLVVVKLLALQTEPRVGGARVDASAQFQDAVSYILNFAASLAPPRPVVINYSIGNDIGPHDGLTEEEDFLTQTFAGAVGKVFVASAGNSSGNLRDGSPARQHARIEFPAGVSTIDIPLELYDPRTNRRNFDRCAWRDATRPLFLDLYYPAAVPPITAAVDLPGDGLGFRPGPAPGAQIGPFPFSNQRQCTMFHSLDSQPLRFTGRGIVTRRNFQIEIEPFRNRHVLGQYVLRLTSPGPNAFRARLWCAQGKGFGFRVALPPAVIPANVFVEDRCQVVSNGGAANILTVAAYDAEHAGHPIAHFSSRGPLANHGGNPVGVVQPPKPTLGAPGVEVDAAKSRDPRPVRPGDTIAKGGTSMAAPHVAGLVALMLQKNHLLTVTNAISILTARATPRIGAETADDIGAGRVDAKNTWDNT
jgi:subtilisin family serine protease